LIDSYKTWKVGDTEVILSRNHGRVICPAQICQCALNYNQLAYHFKKNHQLKEADIQEILDKVNEYLDGFPEIPVKNLKEPMLPFPSLPIFDGFKCSFCAIVKYFTDEKGFRYHLRHTHSMKNIPVEESKCKVQKLNKREKGSEVFPVTTVNAIIKGNSFTYEEVMGEIDLTFRCGKIPKVYQALGWIEFFQVREWAKERSVIKAKENRNDGLETSIKAWFATTYSTMKREAPKKYNLMLHLGYEKL
jgi:hypothetical protein